jgi:3-deoxy-D-arabino-heptulosonate 7-phosphate (DAHP) synthase
MSDAKQQLSIPEFRAVMQELKKVRLEEPEPAGD